MLDSTEVLKYRGTEVQRYRGTVVTVSYMQVEEKLVGAVLGPSGRHVVEIQQYSGATIQVLGTTVTCLPSPVTCHLSPVTCHLSPVCCLLSAVCCLLGLLFTTPYYPDQQEGRVPPGHQEQGDHYEGHPGKHTLWTGSTMFHKEKLYLNETAILL